MIFKTTNYIVTYNVYTCQNPNDKDPKSMCKRFLIKKEPTHYSRRVGDEVAGVVAVLCDYMGGWV